MVGRWRAVREDEQRNVDYFATDHLECPSAEPTDMLPRLLAEQLLPQPAIAGQEEPVLRRHQRVGTPLHRKRPAALEEDRRQVRLGVGIVLLAELLQLICLLAPRQIGHVGGDQRIAPGQQPGRAGHAARGLAEEGRRRVVRRPLARQRPLQQRLHLREVDHEEPVPRRDGAGVDQAAQRGRISKERVKLCQRVREPSVLARQAPPGVQLPLDRDARAGDVRYREWPVAIGFPGREDEREGGDLRATRIQLQAEQVVAQHGLTGLGAGEPLLFHAHLPQQVEGFDEEVSRAAAGIQHGHLGGAVRPVGEGAGRWRAVVADAEVGQFLPEWTLGVAGDPPGTERVLEQEADHVVLGEELGDGRELLSPDPPLAAVHLRLLLRLPELVAPAERVLRVEDGCREAHEQALERDPALRGEADLHRRVVGPEDTGQHLAGVASCQRPGIRLALLGRQLLTLRDRYRHAERVYQEPVLGQEAGEQHPVPLLIGDLLDEGLQPVAHDAVSELTRARAQRVAQPALVRADPARRLRPVYR